MFDVVWRDGLVHKMLKLGFKPGICKIIGNFLAGRSFVVGLGGLTSDIFDMINGMPQDSVLSPSLFNIYVHDFPTDNNIKVLQFTDDTTLYLTHDDPKSAQNYFNIYLARVVSFVKKWKLLFSEGKTEFIDVMGRVADTNFKIRRGARNMKIALDGKIVPIKNEIRLLGVQLQTNNLFTKNVRIRLEKTRRAKFAIKRVLKNKMISSSIKTSIYKIYLRSILTYAAPVWCHQPSMSSHQMELFRNFERGCLRSAANIKRDIGSFKHIRAEEIYKQSECDRIDRFIANLHCNFYDKCLKSKNHKFKFRQFNSRGRYKPAYHLHKLRVKNRLFDADNNLTYFNSRFNGLPGLVYNVQQ